MADLRARSGSSSGTEAFSRFPDGSPSAISWRSFRAKDDWIGSNHPRCDLMASCADLDWRMRAFGRFQSDNESFYGELVDDQGHQLRNPYWIDTTRTGSVRPVNEVKIEVPVAPSKLIAVGLNYAEHIAEMKRDELGAPLIWFKAPSSLLAHLGVIEIALPEHRTDFEVELAVVIGTRTKNVQVKDALDHAFGYTIALDITDRDLQKVEKQFGRCKSFDTYTPIGPFVHADVGPGDVSVKLWQNGELRQS